MENQNIYFAVDVSKKTLQLQKSEGNSFCLPYDETGLKTISNEVFRKQKSAGKNLIVVFEATGGYERPLRKYLEGKGILWAMAHPAQVRAFAKSKNIHAKTDPMDAELILLFAQHNQTPASQAATLEQEKLTVLFDRREQLVEMISKEKIRLQNSGDDMHASLKRVLRILKNEQEKIEEEIRELVKNTPKLLAAARRLETIDGVAEISAWGVLAYGAELPQLGCRQTTALAGLAPFNRDSGSYCGKRNIRGGRFKLRKILYMPTRVATQRNAHIAEYYNRLRARGKPDKCAMVAAMNKLLLHIRATLINLQNEQLMSENNSNFELV